LFVCSAEEYSTPFVSMMAFSTTVNCYSYFLRLSCPE
jgi:hypothetical protein